MPPRKNGAPKADRESTVREKITRSKSALIALSSLIACRGEVSDTRCDDTIDRLGDDAVLEHRLGEVQYVVNDDFRAGCCKGKDVRGESGLPVERRGERKTRAWSDVMDNLQYSSAFVGSFRADRNLLDNRSPTAGRRCSCRQRRRRGN